MDSLLRATVVKASADDGAGLGRVTLQAAGVWDESMLAPVLNNIPLNVGDKVYVDVSGGVANPLVLGRCKDNNFKSDMAEADYQLLWDSVYDGKWSVAYVKGGVFHFENSSGVKFCIQDGVVDFDNGATTMNVTGGTTTLNGGKNLGLVNILSLKDFISKVYADLLVAKSGANVGAWIASEINNLQDSKILH